MGCFAFDFLVVLLFYLFQLVLQKTTRETCFVCSVSVLLSRLFGFLFLLVFIVFAIACDVVFWVFGLCFPSVISLSGRLFSEELSNCRRMGVFAWFSFSGVFYF